MMEPHPGTYCLILRLPRVRLIEVGRLGCQRFEKGWYAYVGSAFGPGGVAARCRHHCRVSERPHWHIDYLRAAAWLEAIWYTYDPGTWEHRWAEALAQIPGAVIPISGFGSTDCRCPGHLLGFPASPLCSDLQKILGQWEDNSPDIQEEQLKR